MKRTTALILSLVAAATTATACSTGDDAVAVGGTFSFVAPGGETDIYYPEEERAPIGTLKGPSLLDENTEISLDDYEGQVVVLNAWGQWCAPCRSESDDLQRVQEDIESRGGTVLGINVRDHNVQLPRDFVKDNGVSYPSIYDPPFKSAVALGGFPATVIPTTIVLDRQHRPAHVFLREVTDTELLEAVNQELS
ncbi:MULTISPECIES: TlpA disulfide reductase family protein [Corynebacterium]|uniref:TlpA disulfide reductase family protein n=1 Tax=Corynebacterium TaxID=1716 RepID=UPI00124C2642|nr:MULTISPECIES: TlpA disulfide reductase family protein [Corynebacterium]